MMRGKIGVDGVSKQINHLCQNMQKARVEGRKLQQELTTAAALRESTQTAEL